jgi:hypothetical protein
MYQSVQESSPGPKQKEATRYNFAIRKIGVKNAVSNNPAPTSSKENHDG